MLKCPSFVFGAEMPPYCREKHCQTETDGQLSRKSARTVKPPRKDDALVELRIVLPYGLRKQAQDEHINCSAFVPQGA